MKPILILLSAIGISFFLIQAISWGKGNENFYTCETKDYINPIEASEIVVEGEYKAYKNYYYKLVIVETVTSSGFPLVFTSQIDTISRTLHGVHR